MILEYSEFCEILYKHIQDGDDFYDELLKNVIKYPSRYCGLYRLSNAKTKLIQNITQSKEIKFGDIIEETVTEYISRLGYQNFDKNLGVDENGDVLNVDQYFTNGHDLYMVEMKVRDDHDSTKKRGQYQNFVKKIKLIRSKNIDKHIYASMWFVDDSLAKNKKFYKNQMLNECLENCTLSLYYGEEFFNTLNQGKAAWNELKQILSKYRIDNADNDITIPDFGNSPDILKALIALPDKYWNKLLSDKEKYRLLRDEVFSSGENLEKAKAQRTETK